MPSKNSKYFKRNIYTMSGVEFEGESFESLENHPHRSDALIETDIKKILLDDSDFSKKNVEFSVKEGLVRLEGTISQHWMRRLIHQEIANIPGVVDVVNHLEISH
jgi:osmotically-inducible protein OsmY